MRLYDAHNHLQDARLDEVRAEWLASAGDAGVQAMVVNGSCEEDWPLVLDLARQSPRVIPSFGLHPWYAHLASPGWFDALQSHLDQLPRAVGEIGLDRWIADPDLPRQEDAFLRQLALAAERNLPASIHCLRHWGRLDELLRTSARPARGFLLHSYGGPAEMVPGFVALGAYFSISGAFFREGREHKLEAFRRIPAHRLLVETDAPDMAGPASCTVCPLPPDAEGRARNHPANLPAIYAAAAALCGEEPAVFADRIERNFRVLFG